MDTRAAQPKLRLINSGSSLLTLSFSVVPMPCEPPCKSSA
jgi:hypothetical protein